MKHKFILRASVLTIIFLAGNVVTGYTQDSSTVASFKTDISLSIGGGTYRSSHYSLSELKQFYPESEILTSMSKAGINYYGNEITGHSSVNFSVGLFKNHPRWLNARHLAGWRIGLNAMQFRILNYNSNGSVSTRIDTLYNQGGTISAYRDSVISYDHSVRIECNIVSLEGSYIVRFNGTKRWSYYTGAGLNGGITSRNEMELNQDTYHSSKTFLVPSGEEFTSAGTYSYTSSSELKKIATGYQVSGFIPFGIDFKLTRRLCGFDFLHLFFEGRTSLNMVNISGLRTSSGTSMQFAFGLRSVIN